MAVKKRNHDKHIAMKRACTLILLFSCSQKLLSMNTHGSGNVSADSLIANICGSWDSIRHIRYDYRRTIHYESIGEMGDYAGDTFFDFSSPNKMLGYRFQFDNPDTKIVYNGSEYFEIDKLKKSMNVRFKSHLMELSNFEFMFNSFLSLKFFFPAIRSRKDVQKSVGDTVIDGKSCFVLVVSMLKEKMAHNGSIFPIQENRLETYRIVIDKSVKLPISVLCTNNVARKDYEFTSFGNYEVNTARVKEDSWFFSSYSNTYPIRHDPAVEILKPGQQAPAWSAGNIGDEGTLELRQFRGRVVLLEFWIANCGYCIGNVQKLNSLADAYKGKPFSIIGINGHDDKAAIKRFYRSYAPVFPTGVDGQAKISGEYGVQAFPTVFLLDKQGMIVYSGYYNESKVKALIDKLLPL